MQFVVDSGSTKANWRLIAKENQYKLETEGYNPYFLNSAQILASITSTLVPQLQAINISAGEIDEVNFYGAGCSTQEKNKIVADALKQFFTRAKVAVNHDLLGAARALLQHQKGFAAILGTGTNTGVYNGNDDLVNIDSLGHFFGDEGSGFYISKKLLRDRMRHYLPKELDEKFSAFSKLGKEEIFDRAYNHPLPNRFVASFFPFIVQNKSHEYCTKLVRDSFEDFFKNLVIHYDNYRQYEFNCVGSVGFLFNDILKQVCVSFEMKPGQIVQEPIDGMVKFHLS